MLERQHSQLIVALQELYRCTQNGQGWPSSPLELVHYGQPLTHKILEGLGVLRADEWDDEEGHDALTSWMNMERQSPPGSVGGGAYDDSATASPSTAITFSPSTMPENMFPDSKIMAKRRSKYDLSADKSLNMPSTTVAPRFFNNNKTVPYNIETTLPKHGLYTQDPLAVQMQPNPISMYGGNNGNGKNLCYPDSTESYMGDESLSFATLDWMSATNDVFGPTC